MLVCIGLAGCAGSNPSRTVYVAPGELFGGGYIEVRAPDSDGWQLAQTSDSGIAFARRGRAPAESFVAQFSMFNLAPTSTPDELKALIKTSVDRDTDTNRFSVQQASYQYSGERSYPCVRHHSVAQDKAPAKSAGPLLLESESLYCRHPERQNTGFAVTYSHRGPTPYANLLSEAESFIQGVQVPAK
jgi:hypothetical protein